jgi:EmrB/QacA subfamily drug resistance transporter
MDSTTDATTHKWFALAVVCVSVTVIVLDNTIMNVALPSIADSLNANSSQLQWIVDAYTLVFASLLLSAGTIGDRYGRRGTLMSGLAIFGVGSVLAAFSTGPWMLIGFRGLMGIGAAAIYPTTLSIITNMFTGKERGRAIGIWAALAGVGVALGPILGGVLLDHWWWGSVLLVNVPIVIVSLVLIPAFVPTSRDPDARPLDPGGFVLSIAGLTALLYGIIEGPRLGWSSTNVVAGLVTGVAVLAAFALWEHHTTNPMLPLEFFENPRFWSACVALSLTFFALFGYIFLLTQYLQFVRGLSPLGAGLRLAAPAVGLIVGAPLAPRLVEHVGTKLVVATGLFVAGAALLLLADESVIAHDISLAPVFALFGLAMGLTMAPATESIMGSVPPARAGVGSAVNDTTRQMGGALGVAILGSVAATHYMSRVGGLGLPPSDASAAKESIGAALQLAQRLPPAAAARLADAARAGFTDGIRLATFVGAAAVIGAALLVVRFLPARESSSPRVDTEAAASRQ